MVNYFDVVNKSIDAVVVTDEKTLVSYLKPLYKEILRISDIEFDENMLPMEDLYEILQLEVAKRNAMNNPTNELMHKLNEFINEKIDPVLEENNQRLIEELLEYMKEKDKKEVGTIDGGIGIMNFAKKNT